MIDDRPRYHVDESYISILRSDILMPMGCHVSALDTRCVDEQNRRVCLKRIFPCVTSSCFCCWQDAF